MFTTLESDHPQGHSGTQLKEEGMALNDINKGTEVDVGDVTYVKTTSDRQREKEATMLSSGSRLKGRHRS